TGGLLEWSKAQSQNFDFVKTLETFRKNLREQHGNAPSITHKNAADDGGVGAGYIIYRELSGDSAHPSATSLSKHVTWDGEASDARFTVHALPVFESGAIDDTLKLACSSVLGVCVAANEILGGTHSGER